ncbi:hypothetical protein V2J09_003139 [Rumex salicifolius]
MTCWWAWKWRNHIIFRDPQARLHRRELIIEQVTDFKNAEARAMWVTVPVSWEKPAPGWVKINVDGAGYGWGGDS